MTGATFKRERFERYLVPSASPGRACRPARLDLQDDTFKDMARTHPQLAPLRELRGALSQMRLSDLAVGDDGRNRCLLSMFRCKTGRNQPSNTRFIFGPSVWLRGLIQPPDRATGWPMSIGASRNSASPPRSPATPP